MPRQPAPAHSRRWKRKPTRRFWNGRSGWCFARRNSRRTWADSAQIDRKRTGERLKVLTRMSNAPSNRFDRMPL